MLTPLARYFSIFLTFARNSLIRDMTFRANFLIDLISSIAWVIVNLAFYTLIFHYTPAIGAGTGWEKYQFFLFLATANSMASRWCPWELGYADGHKSLDRIAIVPTFDGTTTHGNEYLQLYRRVDVTNAGELLWVPAGSNQGQYVRTVPFL